MGRVYDSHPQCERCWIAANGTFTGPPLVATIRMPVRLAEPVLETCCWCSLYTISGIYVRARTADLLCEPGDHDAAPEMPGQGQYH